MSSTDAVNWLLVVGAVLLSLGTLTTFRQARTLARELRGASDLLSRVRASRREAATFLRTRAGVAKATDTTTAAVTTTTAVTRSSHRAIASIPFGILGAIPATAPVAKRVQQIHDGIAEAVYDSIDQAAEQAKRSAQDRLLGAARDADGSDPPGPPTRRDDRLG